ncbi:MAG: phenylalanine--tRNA ligase subunit beta [Peptococcaceae bacterium]|nr:phenylalanine--tRNA ligase subunit beta [Peptococcaceae bacterium]
MRVSWKWLGSLVDLSGYSPQQLADILTRGGVETGAPEFLHPGFSGVVVGEIVSAEKHPGADTLRVCQVDVGAAPLDRGNRDGAGLDNLDVGVFVSVVTGAANVFVGDRVPVALPGAVLPGIEGSVAATELRGVASGGLLCSEKELGLSFVGTERSRDGVLILPADAPLGSDLGEYLELDDWVLDLELYPNRADCLAMIYVAREVGALIDRKAVLPVLVSTGDPWAAGTLWPASAQEVVVEAVDWSRRYAALLVENVVVEPSPMWLQNRLRAAGIRPISNIVDLTNYCMLEQGQPLHAFDLDKLAGAIRVRRARVGERLTTLDDVERDLSGDMLVIADDNGPVAIAGVMGGLETEVTETTRRVLFESAHFQGACVRRTSRRLGLRSESSLRFEKGVDAAASGSVLERLACLLGELNAGEPVGFKEQMADIPARSVIVLDVARVAGVLGVAVAADQVREAMERQEFVCRRVTDELKDKVAADRATDTVFEVEIPTYRQDLKIEEDLIEEVARMIGYDMIPTTSPYSLQTQGLRSEEQVLRRRVRHGLVEAGMNEVVSYAFVGEKDDGEWGTADRQVRLLNPLRDDMSVMRTSLVPGLLSVAGRNVARQNSTVAFFEIGNIYLARKPVVQSRPIAELPDEEMKVAGVVCGKEAKHWSRGEVQRGFFYLKGILEAMGKRLGVTFLLERFQSEDFADGFLHPGRSAVVFAGDRRLGYLGELHPQAAQKWDLRQPVVFELDLQVLGKAAKEIGHGLRARTIVAKGYPRYPAVQRDLALLTAETVAAGAIEERIRALGGELLQQAEIFDVYTGPPVPPGYKSLAFSLHYQSKERTLTDEEVDEANQTILQGIQEEFGAERRMT